MTIAVNARYLVHGLTGVQRYAREIVSRLPGAVETIRPSRDLKGLPGHLWEQVILPIRSGSEVLWNPCGTGPLVHPSQVVTVHDLSPLDHPEWFSTRYAAWHRWLIPRLARRAAHLIAVSEATAGRLLELDGVDRQDVTVVPNAVSSTFAPARPRTTERVREQLAIPTRDYVLYLGSLEPRKNLGNLVRAWGNLDDRVRDETTLVVAGPKGRPQVFAELGIGQLPKSVHVTGFVPDEDLPALYSGAVGFAYPSFYEGFGLPILEAMACGTPVITSNRSSLPEVAGDAAILVDPESTEAIQAALTQLLTDSELREDLSHRGRERAMMYSWDRTASETLQVLRGVGAEFP